MLEVQLRIDDDKFYSWPAYLILGRSRRRCETFVLVVAPDPAVAAWARKPIHLGPGNDLRVFVLGPAEIPTITDIEVAIRHPELAVLALSASGLGRRLRWSRRRPRRVESSRPLLCKGSGADVVVTEFGQLSRPATLGRTAVGWPSSPW